MDFFGIDLAQIIKTVGYAGLFVVIFAETGLFLGFFLPGDSLLFVAGLLVYQGFFNVAMLVLVIFIAAVLGNIVAYAFGYRVGARLFQREDSRFFRKKHLETAHAFYDQHGGKTIFLARFIPIVRTFAPIVAGVGKMNYASFLTYNVAGAFIWSSGLVVSGYLLGSVVKDVDRYILPIVLLIIVVSFLPGVSHYLKEKKKAVAPSLLSE